MPAKLKEWDQLSESEKQLINILNQIQEEQGYIPHYRLTKLAEESGVPEAQLHGLVSFFNSFRSSPAGKHKLSICYGTACYARGAALIYDRMVDELNLEDNADTSTDGFVTVDHVFCVGACSQAPLVVLDGVINGKIKSYQVPIILEDLRKKG